MASSNKHGDYIDNSQLWNFANLIYGDWRLLKHRSMMHCLQLILSYNTGAPWEHITDREVVDALAKIVGMVVTNNPGRASKVIHTLSSIMILRSEKRTSAHTIAAHYSARLLRILMSTEPETRSSAGRRKVLFKLEPRSEELAKALKPVFARAGVKDL